MVDIGSVVPDFALQNQDGQTIRLSELRGKRIVLFTFQKAGTMGCTAEVCAMRDNFPKFETNDVIILGMGSNDTPDELRAWRAKERLPYDLLVDADGRVATELGIRKLSVFNFQISAPVFGMVIIDEQGKLAYHKVPVAPWETAKRAVEALNALPQSTQA